MGSSFRLYVSGAHARTRLHPTPRRKAKASDFRFTFQKTKSCFPAARSRPGFAKLTLEKKRAQGMPGDGLTHGPPATKKAGGSHHRISRINRHSLRNGVTAYAALSPVSGL
jgi:hypothetical protein